MKTQSESGQASKEKTQSDTKHVDKTISILILFAISAAIVISGAAYSVYSAINHTSFHILNTDMPGYILGAVAIFLGVRYIKAVIVFGKKVDISGTRFSWKNFKRTIHNN